MELIKKKLKEYISLNGNSHILIHSDVLFGLKIKFENQEQYLKKHISELIEISAPLDIIMPSFNYDFCKGKTYDIKKDISQVGTLSEYFRKNISTWRTSIPVFNFSGTGGNPIPEFEEVIDPFDDTSMFGFLDKNKGILMHYGSGFNTTTLIHYVERISERLIYRYDKEFNGVINSADNQNSTSKLKYHVRPMNFSLNYDWDKIESDLIKEKVILKIKEGRTQIIIGRTDEIVKSWLSKIKENPFYFLNKETKKLVKKKYNKLERPFLISDFE